MWVADYLSKFKNYILAGRAAHGAVSEEVRTLAKVELRQDQISIRDGVARITGLESVERSVVYLKKKAILEGLKKRGVSLYDIK